MSKAFIPENPHLRQSKLRQIFEQAPAGSLNLGIGQPGEGTPEFIREAAKKVAQSKSLGYTLNAGLLSLREKLAAEMNGQEIHPDQICITAGVQQALFSLFFTLSHNDTTILLPDPGFLTYPALANINKWSYETYCLSPEDNFRFKADAVIEAITPETTAILLAHPSNPTGSGADKHEYKKLIDYLNQREGEPVWIISDEVYYGMMYEEEDHSLLDFFNDYQNMVVLRGASKSHHMTGWRLAWMYFPLWLKTNLIASHQYVTTCASAVSQHTFELIRGTDEEKAWFAEQKSLYHEKSQLVHRYLSPHRDLFGGEGAFYWLIKLDARKDTVKGTEDDEKWVWNLLREHKIISVPGSAFGEQTKGYVRISYGPKMEELKAGLERLAGVLSEAR